MTQVILRDKKQRKEEKKRIEAYRKRRKRVNLRIERAVSFLAILICVIFSVLEVLEKKKVTGGTGRKEGAAGDE